MDKRHLLIAAFSILLTSSLVRATEVCQRTTEVRQALEAVIGKNCQQIIPSDLEAVTELMTTITKIKSGDLDGLKSLRRLVIKGPSIVELPVGLFDDLSSVQLVEISDTRSSSLPNGMLQKTKSLHSFALTGNRKLTSIPEELFLDLPLLRRVSISDSPLTSLPGRLFQANSSLLSLIISGTDSFVLPEDFFASNLNLREISLGQVAVQDPNAFAGLLMLESLQVKMDSLSEDSFRGLQSLSSVHLTTSAQIIPTQLFQQSPLLQWITLNATVATSLPVDLFQELTQLKFLQLGGAFVNLPAGLFRNLPELNSIRFKNCLGLRIQSGLFHDIPKLEHISFFEFRFPEIAAGHFMNLPRLRRIELSKTDVKSIEAGALSGMPRLRELSLAYNSIATLPPRVFESLPNLRKVNLIGNKITDLSPEVFGRAYVSPQTEVFLSKSLTDSKVLTMLIEQLGSRLKISN